ncbi:MAG: ATP-binding protein [Longimicrobiales bacterium]|nr:ATP-binding protein [Longimicrobiales bacterium]
MMPLRLRVHHPLFAGFVAVIGFLVAIIVPLVGRGLRGELYDLHQNQLERQLDLAEALVDASPSTDADSLARLITARVENRVTFIDLEGRVLGDSFVEPARLPEVENHIGRPEVQGVLGGASKSFARRTSATVGLPLLYGARMATLGGEPIILRIATPLTSIEAAVDGVQRTVALIGLLTLLLALLGAYGLSKLFTRPLVALAERAGELAQGDVTSDVPLGRVAELQDLARAFNRLTDELQTRLSELARERDEMQTLIDCMAEGVIALTEDARLLRMNRAARALLELDPVPAFAPVSSVVRDEALRKALERSVTVEGQAAEIEMGGRHVLLASRALDSGGAVTTLLDITEVRHLEQVRRDFVANASHELKTPLTSIRGFAETLTEADPPDHLRKQFLESIRLNTLRLQRLVDDLLDLSRLESGGWAAAEEPVVLSEAVAEGWDLVECPAGSERTFTVEGEALVLGDRAGLVQIFRNLLENAVRHTSPSGTIRVTIRTDEGEGTAHVGVSDDGEGIPLKSLPRIFERFYRADSSRARDVGGTGLGLAIVKHLVGAMGGEIDADSTLGVGTTIRFTLPLAGPS